jgi:predicted RNA-binding protein with PIN domain
VNNVNDYQRNRVHVHFVRRPMTADDAILARLLGTGKAARNYTVVSGDRTVQERARRLGAGILSSQNFARQLEEGRHAAKKGKANPPGGEEQGDIQEWLDLFNQGDKNEKDF